MNKLIAASGRSPQYQSGILARLIFTLIDLNQGHIEYINIIMPNNFGIVQVEIFSQLRAKKRGIYEEF